MTKVFLVNIKGEKRIAQIVRINQDNEKQQNKVMGVRFLLNKHDFFYKMEDCIYDDFSRKLIQLNEILYKSLNEKDDRVLEFFSKRSFPQRLENYLQIAEGLEILN